MAVAVFSLGGAAVGKTATIQRLYIGTRHLPGIVAGSRFDFPPQPGFDPRRHFDPDQYKPGIGSMYSDQVGADGLHGPSGPVDMDGFRCYPLAEQTYAREYIMSLGFSSVEEFGRLAIPGPKKNLFGGGLTHEASSFIAAANLEGQIGAGPWAGSFVWDAVGNPGRYKRWIDRSLAEGFERIEILHVSCPLPVAQWRAAKRKRRVIPEIVSQTHAKAEATATELLSWVDAHPRSAQIHLIHMETSNAGERKKARAAGYV